MKPYWILIIILFVVIVLIFALYVYLNLVYASYKKKTFRMSFEESWEVLSMIVKSEIELYETDVFEHKKAITNANFENFYNDLSKRIISKISDDLMNSLTHYMTYEAVISYIARTVKKYLASYVKNPL